jgi:hypothetical protein
MLATQFNDFGLGEMRRNVAEPLAGHGIVPDQPDTYERWRRICYADGIGMQSGSLQAVGVSYLSLRQVVYSTWRHVQKARKIGCGEPPLYPSQHPFGISTLLESGDVSVMPTG